MSYHPNYVLKIYNKKIVILKIIQLLLLLQKGLKAQKVIYNLSEN